jgi:hypothetical protein
MSGSRSNNGKKTYCPERNTKSTGYGIATGVAVFLMALLLAGSTNISAHPAYAQHPLMPRHSTGSHVLKMPGQGTTTNGMNNNMSMFDVFKSAKNITGSVNIIKLANTALAQNLNTSLADAIHNAQQNVGGNQSTAVAAHLTMVNGYLVYRVVVLGNDGMIHFVLVDPGNGSILDTHSFTLQQVITMILVAIHRPYMQMGMMQHMGMMHGSPEMPNMESMMPQNNWNMADMTMPTK